MNEKQIPNNISWHIEPVSTNHQTEKYGHGQIVFYDPKRKTYMCNGKPSVFSELCDLLGVPKALEESDCDAVCICSNPPDNFRFIICLGNNEPVSKEIEMSVTIYDHRMMKKAVGNWQIEEFSQPLISNKASDIWADDEKECHFKMENVLIVHGSKRYGNGMVGVYSKEQKSLMWVPRKEYNKRLLDTSDYKIGIYNLHSQSLTWL